MAKLSIKLSGEELVYLVGEFDGTILPGISDPFAELDDAERTQKIIEIEDRLQEKGYRKRAFGGKTNYDEGLSDMIKICADFKYYIGFDKKAVNCNFTTERFYYNDEKWLQISGEQDFFTLNIRSKDDVMRFISNIPKDAGDRSNQISILVPKIDFESIADCVQSGNVELAKENIEKLNIDAFNEKFLIDGLSFQIEYSAITIVSRDGEGIKEADSVAAFIGDGVMAELYNVISDDFTSMVGLRTTTSGNWIKIREVIMNWLTAS